MSLHLKIPLGATKTLTGTWWTTSAKTTVKDLTGYEARMQFRPDTGSDVVLLDLDSGSGAQITITGGTGEGNFVVTIDDSLLANVAPGPAVWDLMILPPSGEPIHKLGTAEFVKTFTPSTVPS